MPRPTAPLVATLLAAAPFASCNCDPVVPPAGAVCGTGSVDGAPFAIDDKKTRMIIVVQRNDGAGCGVFHNHVVNAAIAKLEYTLKTEDPAGSSFKMTVLADGLDPDDTDLRTEFLTNHDPPLDGQPLSDGDRQSIRGSIAEEVIAKDNPQLTFTISDLSTVNGAGTAKVTADLAGASSTVDATYTVTKDGESFVIQNATAILDGAPYGIPRNSLGFCVNPIMELHFDLVLTKAEATPVCNLGDGQAYEPQFFDDLACAENVGFNEVREVAVKRCAGCHTAEADGPLRLGATVPLVQWEDFRTDSLRNPGRPLFDTADIYIHEQDATQGLQMPPIIDGLAVPLTTEEIALWDAWVADGARNGKCENDPGPTTFARPTKVGCVDAADPALFGYVDPDPNPSAQGLSPKNFFDNYCAFCHADATDVYNTGETGVPQTALLDAGAIVIDPDSGGSWGLIDKAIAEAPVDHGYYAEDNGALLSFWETSVLRFLDGSMPPPQAQVDPTATCTDDADCGGFACFASTVCVDPSFLAFADWVQVGSPFEACP